MSITELDLTIKEIEWTYDLRNLTAIRAKLQGMLKRGQISHGIYHGLNKDLRDRADWLQSQSKKRRK